MFFLYKFSVIVFFLFSSKRNIIRVSLCLLSYFKKLQVNLIWNYLQILKDIIIHQKLCWDSKLVCIHFRFLLHPFIFLYLISTNNQLNNVIGILRDAFLYFQPICKQFYPIILILCFGRTNQSRFNKSIQSF